MTIDQERDGLISHGSTLQNQIIRQMVTVQELNVNVWESIFRRHLRESEEQLRGIASEFVDFEARSQALIQRLATAKTVNQRPLSLNDQFVFAIYISQISATQATIRTLYQGLNDLVSSRRTQADGLTNSLVNYGLLALTVFSLFVAISTYFDARKSGDQQLRSLRSSNQALESVIANLKTQVDVLDRAKATLQSQLAISEAQNTRELEQLAKKPKVTISLNGVPEKSLLAQKTLVLPIQTATRLTFAVRNLGDAPVKSPALVFTTTPGIEFVRGDAYGPQPRDRNQLQMVAPYIQEIEPYSQSQTTYSFDVTLTIPETVKTFDMSVKIFGENLSRKTLNLHFQVERSDPTPKP